MKNRTLNKILVVLISMFGCVGLASADTISSSDQWNGAYWKTQGGVNDGSYILLPDVPSQSNNEMLIKLEDFARHSSDANSNTGLGTSSLNSLTTGTNNTALGALALQENTTGTYNTANGKESLWKNTTGSENTAIGVESLRFNTTGSYNAAVGSAALRSNTTGNYNTANGQLALHNNTTGNNNTTLGDESGFENITGSGNIFLGYKAGYNETGSDKLYISNSNTASPLIYGDFSTGEIKINGDLKVDNLLDANGVSVIRKVGNVVHIGANSVTIEDSTTTTSGKDEIGSTINDLQIGTGASHNTTIEGTLTVQTPTADGHAATKSYVDTQTSSFTSSINSNTSNITINTNDIKNLSTGLAQSMAMASLATPVQGRSSFSIGTGYYDGKSALAYGFAQQNKSGNGLIRIMGASAGGVNSGAASFSWGF